MRKLTAALAATALALALIFALTSNSSADPNLPNIGAHRHFVLTADGGLREVGPRLCDNPALQNAFNQFHANVHTVVAGSTGPQGGAPGLHNGFGTEIVARPCSFVPPR